MLTLPSISTNTNNNNMGIEFSSQNLNHVSEVRVSEQKAKRTKSPGVRIVGNRIYDSANGKTCHQCRQKTMDLAASCKNLKAGKPCVIRYCHKCLLNRYGEKAAEVELLSNWRCPKCRGVCNCSFCRKRQGLVPTGVLAHTAKASGFKSVADMLHNVNNVTVSPMEETTVEKEHMIGNNNSSCESNGVSLLKPLASDKELVVVLSGEAEKENSLDGNNGLKLDSLKDKKKSPEISKKTKRVGLKEISNGNSVDDACEKRSPKRSKICNEDPEEESKRNANDGLKLLHEIAEKVLIVSRNHDLFNPSQYDVKEEMYGKNWKGAELSDDYDNAAIKSQMGITQAPKFTNCTVNYEIEKIQEVPLPPVTMLTDILEIEFPPEVVGNALQFLEFCRVFGQALDVKKGEAVSFA